MITPSKFVSLDDSIISKLPAILSAIHEKMTIRDLYAWVESEFETANEFLLAIDVLHILGKVDVDLNAGVIAKC